MGLGLVIAVRALLALGHKVISPRPGLIRASIVSKLQFPGTTALGWRMMRGCDAIIAAMYYVRNRSVPDPEHQQRCGTRK